MASWKELIDPKLKSEFEKSGPDPRAAEKVRARFLKSLDTALAQSKSETPTKGKKMWKKANGVIEFSPTLGGNPVALDGDTTLYLPAERFESFIEALMQSVTAGELDAAFEASEGSGSGSRGGITAVSGKKQRTLSEQSKVNIKIGGFRRGGMADDEITAKLKSEGFGADLIKAGLTKAAPVKKK